MKSLSAVPKLSYAKDVNVSHPSVLPQPYLQYDGKLGRSQNTCISVEMAQIHILTIPSCTMKCIYS